MVEGRTVAIIAVLTAVGGYYLSANRLANKMCSDSANFSTKMSAFAASCPKPPNALDVMRYYTF